MWGHSPIPRYTDNYQKSYITGIIPRTIRWLDALLFFEVSAGVFGKCKGENQQNAMEGTGEQ